MGLPLSLSLSSSSLGTVRIDVNILAFQRNGPCYCIVLNVIMEGTQLFQDGKQYRTLNKCSFDSGIDSPLTPYCQECIVVMNFSPFFILQNKKGKKFYHSLKCNVHI